MNDAALVCSPGYVRRRVRELEGCRPGCRPGYVRRQVRELEGCRPGYVRRQVRELKGCRGANRRNQLAALLLVVAAAVLWPLLLVNL